MLNEDNQRVRMTKKLLQESMLLLLEAQPLAGISVVSLCSAAGINRSTFYRHYTCPDDVVREMEEEILRQINCMIQEIEPDNEKSEQTCMNRVYRYLYQNSRSIRLLLRQADFGIQLLEQTASVGIFGRWLDTIKDDQTRKMASTFVLHGAYRVICDWLTEDEPMPPEQFAARIRQVLNARL